MLRSCCVPSPAARQATTLSSAQRGTTVSGPRWNVSGTCGLFREQSPRKRQVVWATGDHLGADSDKGVGTEGAALEGVPKGEPPPQVGKSWKQRELLQGGGPQGTELSDHGPMWGHGQGPTPRDSSQPWTDWGTGGEQEEVRWQAVEPWGRERSLSTFKSAQRQQKGGTMCRRERSPQGG